MWPDRRQIGVIAAEFPVRGAEKDAAGAAFQAPAGNACILERPPGGLERQPLAWVHDLGLAGGQAEELRLEKIGAVDEATVARNDPAGHSRVGIVKRRSVPPVRRNLRTRQPSPAHQIPKETRKS